MKLPNWNLNSLFKSDAEALNFLTLAGVKVASFETDFKDKIIHLKPTEILTAIKQYEAISDDLGKAGSYAYLRYAINMNDEKVLILYQSISERISEIAAKLAFFTIELNSLPENILNEEVLAFFKPFLKQNRIFKPYELSKELEEMLIRKSITSTDAWVRFYDETLANLKFNLDGKKVNISIILDKLSSKKSEERKLAAKELGKILGENIKTFTFAINTIIKDKQIEDDYRGFEKPIDSRNLSNFVETEVVESLIQSVKDSYPALSHKYYSLKAKIFKSESLKYWDRNAPLPFDNDKAFSFEEAKKITLESYREFSPKMSEIAELFFKNNWIDAEVKEGKDSGAFSHSTVPSANPFVMLNFLGKTRDVATMAHELGHGVHQFLAKKQGALMAGTPLTLAETASVFGEMLVFQNLLKLAQTKEEKLAILGGKIEDMLNTVVRQIAFCDFETKLHNLRKEEELTADVISKAWLEVQGESLGNAIVFEDEYKNFWGYISHFFHAPFYVYAYAFGDCLVNSLYAIYKEGKVANFEEKYLEMLSFGGSLHHSELLKPFGINLQDKQFWNGGLNILKSYINEFEKLLVS
jgi:oligoendopeptidase F